MKKIMSVFLVAFSTIATTGVEKSIAAGDPAVLFNLTQAAQAKPIVQITDDVIGGPGSMSISGNRIVWGGPDSDNISTAHAQIYLYDMSTGIQTQLTSGSGDSSQPALDGNNLVYDDPKQNIILQNLTTNTQQTIATKSAYPSISGDYVAFADIHTFNLHLYNLSTKTSLQLTTGQPNVSDIVVDGNRVVYLQNTPPALHLYDISTKVDTLLTTLSAPFLASLSVSGNHIVYIDGLSSPQVFLYDLSSKTALQISNVSEAPSASSVEGNLIVWTNNTGSAQWVAAYNITTQKTTAITNPVSLQELSRLSGPAVYWLDNRANQKDWQFYLYQLPLPPVAAPNIVLTQIAAQPTLGTPFTYQIVALGGATSYAATGLPPGLAVDASTGLISGSPTAAGTFTVSLSATNSLGTGTRQLTLTVH